MTPGDHVDWSAIVTTIATSFTTIAVALIERSKHRRRKKYLGRKARDVHDMEWSRTRRAKPDRRY